MEAMIGGVIIGSAVSLMLLFTGRVTGISGIVGGVLNRDVLDKSWRILFLSGLVLGGILLRFIHPEALTLISNANNLDYIVAGLLVGFGTSLGSGCTSGHGVCGISRFSFRSIIATLIFILSGMLSVVLFKFIRGEL